MRTYALPFRRAFGTYGAELGALCLSARLRRD